MTQRRSLVEGLGETPKVDAKEREFVYGGGATEKPKAANADTEQSRPSESGNHQARGKVPLTTRCRPELAMAIKRASLERQMSGVKPSSIQDIIEHALEDWLAANS